MKAISASEVGTFIRGETIDFSSGITSQENHQLVLPEDNCVYTYPVAQM